MVRDVSAGWRLWLTTVDIVSPTRRGMRRPRISFVLTTAPHCRVAHDEFVGAAGMLLTTRAWGNGDKA
jgi:hypothetical protein